MRTPKPRKVPKLPLKNLLTPKGIASLETTSEISYAEITERLYDLDRAALRMLAWEALLISDGPDHIEGNADNAAIGVNRQRNGTFKVFERSQDDAAG